METVASAPESDAEAVFKKDLLSEFPEYQSRLDFLLKQEMSCFFSNDDLQNKDIGSLTTT